MIKNPIQHKLKFLVSICLLFASTFVQAQQIYSTNKYPITDFRQPLDISPPALAGSFGEIRGNHFHSGIDFRTNQREGYPVYAVADGYISRLRVQNSGFGQALYINHPNGFTTVYGHLQRFAPKIATIVKNLEYEKKSFEIDEFPDATLIPVHKGEIIAWSGNRGSSGGPHLHFEIRDTRTEETINSQFFGIVIPDNIPPVIHGLYVYRLNGKTFNESTPKQAIGISGANGSYKTTAPISLTGEVGFGLVVTDRHNGLSGTNGVYSIQLEVDGKKVYTSALERFAFEDSKAINSHIDYPTYLNTKRSIQKSFVEPGNPLKIYSGLVNSGRINFNDGASHQLRYIITDSKGNSSVLPFTVNAGTAPIAAPVIPPGIIYPYNKVNEFNTDDIKVVFPVGTLYSNLNFTYKKLPKPTGNAWSAVHQIHNKYTPLHIGFDISIKADNLPENLRSKALIVNSNGTSQGGFFESDYVKATPKNFGSFYIAIDTLAPRIVPVNIAEGKNMAGLSKIFFRISDNLSGIKSFNGYIDGKWALMEFDTKTATLWHSFDERTTSGKHILELVVVDMKENTRKYTVTFFK
ncbi:M23 family metallopeptidase [Pedobacter sp. ISL-68]|uniref:M23 family metallopeptidase n=1 Tax=unclassified Pedobacter TaxID=2628915 RepID=UPI001BE6BE1A|nr:MULTISPECIES: M23 family metallopeptidase [unclassified Pedobacter]MBT2563498.1 M23 family metallopeptidase [Pedobacter sp. ISL-64]MBT2592882.1 M23 family metallopeptidase [Pedobacter sp. ISL-68]